MRVAVISDTHLGAPDAWFQRFFRDHLAQADALVHCGDMVGKPMLDFLEANHPNFHGVAGNCCDWQVRQELPAMLRVSLGGYSVGVTHGWGDRPSLPARLPEAFGPGFDLILFGHTHRPTNLRFGDTLVVNPGSLNQDKPCFALIELSQSIAVDLRCLPAGS